jgi:hypothetical protein
VQGARPLSGVLIEEIMAAMERKTLAMGLDDPNLPLEPGG